MSTVSTSHTVQTTRSRSSAPLRVPKRPPRNDVTQAIQKFLPYAVVFLLSLMLYSSLRSSNVSYPPYSPPNVGEATTASSIDLASILNKRADRLEDLKRRSEANDVPTGHWATWRAQKMNELDEKKKAANMQAKQGLSSIPAVITDAFAQAKVVAMAYGEKMVEFSSEKLANTQDYAYDAMFSWKQKMGVRGPVVPADEPVMERAEDLTQGFSQAAYDLKFRNMAMELLRTEPFNRMMQNNTSTSFAGRLASFVSSIKDSLGMSDDARHIITMKEEWEKIDVSKRADMIIQQLQFLGDNVIEEVFRKLGHERSECVCLDEQVCR